ncbi:MAG TPA: AsmA family protein [Xanthomonadales bacterium]|nr:AsmA family protein [Xanthomonadales bacterium]
MKRALKIVFTGLTVLTLLLSIAVTWMLHDDDFLKGWLERYVMEKTGSEMTLGRLELDLGKKIGIDAGNLQFDNAEWASADYLAQIGIISAEFDTASLLRGKISLESLVINDARINLQKDESGRTNWDIFSSEKDADPDSESDPKPLAWKTLEVSEFELIIDSPERAEPLAIRIARIDAKHSLTGRVDMNVTGEIDGQPMKIEGFADPLHAIYTGGAIDHRLEVDMGDIYLESQGTIDDALTGAGARINTRFSGPEIGWLLEQAALPAFSSGEFDIDISLDSTDGDSVRLDLDGNLGSLLANANGELDQFVDPSKLDLDFDIRGPDLLALGEAFGVSHLPAQSYEFIGKVHFLNDTLTVEQFDAKVSEDNISVSGVIGPWPQLANTELSITANGESIRTWESALGMSGWKPNPFSVSGRFSEQNGLVQLQDVNASVGNNLLSVEGALGTPPRMVGSDIDLKIVVVDLGEIAGLDKHSFARQLPLSFEGNLLKTDQGIEFVDSTFASSQHRLGVDGLLALVPKASGQESQQWQEKLNGSDIKANLSTPDVQALAQIFDVDDVPKMPLEVATEIRLDSNGLGYQFATNNSDEITITIDGQSPDPRRPLRTNGSFVLELPSLNFIESFGDISGVPDHPISAKGLLNSDSDTLGFENIEGSIGDASFSLDGSLGLTPDITITRAEFSASGPDFRAFYDHENISGLPQKFEISGSISPGTENQQVEGLKISLGQTSLELSGTVDQFPQPEKSDLDVVFKTPDPEALEVFLDYHGINDYPRLPIQLEFVVKQDSQLISVPDIRLGIGPDVVLGDASIVLGPIPEVHGSFSSEAIDLTWLYDFGEEIADQGHDLAADTGSAGSSTRLTGEFFSETPYPLLAIDPIVIDLLFDFGRVSFGNLVLPDVDFGVELTESFLKLDPIRLNEPSGGQINATFNLAKLDGKLDATLKGLASGFRTGLLADPNLPITAYPPTDLRVDLRAVGASQREMASTLNGQLEIILGKGQVLNRRLNLVFSDIVTEVFQKLNPFTKTSDQTNVECGVLVIEFRDGEALVDPLILQSDKIVSTSRGDVDMRTERVNLQFSTRTRTGIGLSASMIINPFIKVGGTLSQPMIVLDPADAAIQGGAAVASAGLSLVGKSLFDRFLRQRDPCGKVVAELRAEDRSEEVAN